jgi:hypothetical protein
MAVSKVDWLATSDARFLEQINPLKSEDECHSTPV